LELTRRILGALPRLKVISSADISRMFHGGPRSLLGHRSLSKTFTVDQLAAVVTEVWRDIDEKH